MRTTLGLNLVFAAVSLLAGCDFGDDDTDAGDVDTGRDVAVADTTDGGEGLPPDGGRDADVGRDTIASADGDAARDADGERDASADGDAGKVVTLRWDFEDGAQGWRASVSDYAKVQRDSIAFESGIRPLPQELCGDRQGYFVSGLNVSDDLFMFLSREVPPSAALEGSQEYRLHWTIRFASDAPRECAGIGGPPGESVYLKAGGSAVEPEVSLDGRDDYRLNIDKGNQSTGGENASVVGTVETSNTDCQERKWEILEKTHTHPEPMTTDADGRMYVIVGTDSGFEGTSSFYYDELVVEFRPISQ